MDVVAKRSLAVTNINLLAQAPCPAARSLGCYGLKFLPGRLHFHSKASRHPLSASAEPELSGVKALLQLDRKVLTLPEVDPYAEDVPPTAPAPETELVPPPAAGKQAARARAQSFNSTPSTLEETDSGPRTAGAAIALGVERLGEGEPREAIRLFQLALELPGKGAFRMRGSPKEYSCASEGEEMAALYNLACAYIALGQMEAAFASLEGAIESGFSDFDTLRNDPDLVALKGPALERLISKEKNNIFAKLNLFSKRKQ